MKAVRTLLLIGVVLGTPGCAMVDLVAHATKEVQKRTEGGQPAEIASPSGGANPQASMAANEPPPAPVAAPAPAVARAGVSVEPLAPPK